jgi:hypothetical protein
LVEKWSQRDASETRDGVFQPHSPLSGQSVARNQFNRRKYATTSRRAPLLRSSLTLLPFHLILCSMDHLEPFRRRVRDAQKASPPPPWRFVTSHAVGGLTEAGFADDGELILVLSWQGRGIFDGISGERISRDRNDDRSAWYGRDRLLGVGFGPLEGQTVRLAGLWGGGLPVSTNDYWRVENLTLNWPESHLLLFEPNLKQSAYSDNSQFYKLLAPISEVRGFGFSYTGKSLLIATSSDLTLYARP